MEELKYYHGEITGYARLQPPAGVGKIFAFGNLHRCTVPRINYIIYLEL